MTYIDDTTIQDKTVLVRVDFNVTLNPNRKIADDFRIRQSLPTIKYLLDNNNSIILVSHLGRPNGREMDYSLKPVAEDLKALLPETSIELVDTVDSMQQLEKHKKHVYLLENIRFYEEEKKNDEPFAKSLAELADVYVNDAFGVSHRVNASTVGITKHLPSFGGLLLKKEVEMIDKVIKNPKSPVVAIIGGAKIQTKINLIGKLIELADVVLVGGGLANTFFKAEGHNIGTSICADEEVENAQKLMFLASKKHTALVVPEDVVLGTKDNGKDGGEVLKIEDVSENEKRAILDIGPETQAQFGAKIASANTIIWNGPVGYNENKNYRRGTEFIYYAIAQNEHALSVVGGGDTLATISKKEYLDRITHISTGGGAMLEYIEHGTLPGLEALKS